MKIDQLKYALVLPLIFACAGVMAQDSTLPALQRKARADSMLRVEQRRSNDLSDLKSEKNSTKAKAEEAQRVERNASTAARESKIAYRSEQRAQKARNKADKQAKKAERARIKSNN